MHTQMVETDEVFIQTSPVKSSGRIRMTSESGSVHDFQRQGSLHRQGSVKRQLSSTTKQEGVQSQVSAVKDKDQEQWDKDLPEVSLFRVIRLNAPEWWMILLGVIASALSGAVFPVFGLVFGEILGVFSLPLDEIVPGVSLYAGLFWVLGFVAGFGFFVKVINHCGWYCTRV